MHCTRCGTPIPDGARFCLGCGTPVGSTDQTVAQAVAQPGRLSDSGALELRTLLVDETKTDYEIHEEVGRGGMAVVYRATEIHLSRQVAVKVLPPELTFGKGAIERFRREAKTAAALDHPNIIPIYRITPGGRLFWYAMKFLEGRSLADVLTEKGLLTVQETIGILEQVGDALDYAHSHGVVHRDIKPGNVMLDSRGRVIVTDFGIAKELQQGAALTGSGNILGTPYYMSPEQCRGGELTGAADQYSLAVMAYQMISGQLPFEADSAIDLLHKHCIEPPPPIDSVLPGLPKHVINALNRGMAKKPTDRFPSVAAFVNGLKGLDTDEDTATIVLTKRPSLTERLGKLATASTAAPARSRRGVRVAAGIGVVAVLGAGAAIALNHRQGPQVAVPPVTPAAVNADSARRADSTRVADSTHLADSVASLAAAVKAPAPAHRPPSTPTAVSTHSATPRLSARERAAARDSVNRAASARRDSIAAAHRAARPPARRGYLQVQIRGGYADIYIDNVKKAESAVWADSLPEGAVTVRIERPGFVTQTRRVSVRSGRSEAVAFTMRAGTP